MKIAVLGSAFNPPTLGHKDVIEQCLGEFDEVWLVPSYKHAFGKSMMPYDRRVRLVEAFITDLKRDPSFHKVKLKACEKEIVRLRKSSQEDEPVYSIELMDFLASNYTNDTFSLVIGPDNVLNLSQFFRNELLIKKYSPFQAQERKKIRSTLVRKALAEGDDIDSLVTESVKTILLQQETQSIA